jgi:hypothetical protein
MPRRSKRTRHCLAAIKKRWSDAKTSFDEKIQNVEYNEPGFDAIQMKDGDHENEPSFDLDDDQFVEELSGGIKCTRGTYQKRKAT